MNSNSTPVHSEPRVPVFAGEKSSASSETGNTPAHALSFITCADSQRNLTTVTNWQAHLYAEIFEAIEEMSRLPKEDDFHLEKEAGVRAENLLGYIKETIGGEPPKILNQNGEAVVFTWDYGAVKRYLTVAEDEIDLMHILKEQHTKIEETIAQEGPIQYGKLFDLLSAAPRIISLSDCSNAT